MQRDTEALEVAVQREVNTERSENTSEPGRRNKPLLSVNKLIPAKGKKKLTN